MKLPLLCENAIACQLPLGRVPILATSANEMSRTFLGNESCRLTWSHVVNPSGPQWIPHAQNAGMQSRLNPPLQRSTTVKI